MMDGLRSRATRHKVNLPLGDRDWCNEEWRVHLSKTQSIMDTFLASRDAPQMLDAGCGSSSHLRIPDHAHRVGIDVSSKQLGRNSDLTERILGDLETYDLPDGRFDLIVCWDVLEHLSRPRLALQNLHRSLASGGMLILGLPNALSVKGLITKLTPHPAHVWFYRRILGSRAAGQGDRGPFQTFLRFEISPAAIRRFAAERGMGVDYVALYESPMQRQVRQKYMIIRILWKPLLLAIRAISGGRIDIEGTDLVVVVRKDTSADAPSMP
jgi:SAM-dependent methyltransferase